jgi:hypothetical protein
MRTIRITQKTLKIKRETAFLPWLFALRRLLFWEIETAT